MKVIITGSTGMVGKGVLIECVADKRIEEILLVNRNSIGIKDHKVKEVILPDFLQFETIKHELVGYDACYHCMGVSSSGMNEKKYEKLTYDVTESLAKTLFDLNPNIIFTYVSGQGTDSSEKGKIMWARIKGKTENLILNMGFKDAYAFRPGAILPEKGVKSKTKWYQLLYDIMRPFYFLLRKLKSVTTSSNLGKAMINLTFAPETIKHIDGEAINRIANKK